MRTAFLTSIVAPTATLAVCYVISVAKGHSEAFMPFISDLDLFQPEDTIFTIGLAISAVAIMVILTALSQVPGTVFFPMMGCTVVVLDNLAARFLWKERLSPATLAGIALALAAISITL